MDKRSCYECKHFHITWDVEFPNGCRIYGFKSKKIPSQMVKESSGKECLSFEQKGKKTNAQRKD